MEKAPQRPAVAVEGRHCTRCLQPVAPQTQRCPNCGTPISRGGRRLSLWIGAGGVGALLFLILLMWLVVRHEDVQKAPVLVDAETEARKQEILADTSKQHDKDAKPAKPEKPPPLNQ